MNAVWLVEPESELQTLLELARKMHAESKYSNEPLDVEGISELLLSSTSIVIGLYNNHELSGGALLYVTHPFWTRSVRVLQDYAIFIDKTHRSFIAFSTLLSKIEEVARTLHCARIELGVTAPKDVLQTTALYQRKGFELRGTLCVKELNGNVL